ncbi:DNA-directed RNA polymerases I and III subunit RPAC1-like isoform X2 [Dysidea avara]
MIGVDASISNAIRRILLAEVPTMAIEKVFMYDNTSIIQDEVLAHRLGLIPILADPREFDFMPSMDEEAEWPVPDEQKVIVLKLKVRCKRNPKPPEGASRPVDLYTDAHVKTSHFEWVPIGDQAKKFDGREIRPVHDDILVAKLRPGQAIDAELHCVKGIGQDHAKFSPVATASYRLLPDITLTKRVTGMMAHRLKKCFPEGVIGIKNEEGEDEAYIADCRRDTSSREVLRHEDLKDCVKLGKKADHFIFTVESTGILSSKELVLEAVKILKEKCQQKLKKLDYVQQTNT